MCFLFNSSTCYMFCVIKTSFADRPTHGQHLRWNIMHIQCLYNGIALYRVYAVCRLHINIYMYSHSHSYSKLFSPLMPAILMNDWICTMHMSGQRNFIWLNIVFLVLYFVVRKHFTFHQIGELCLCIVYCVCDTWLLHFIHTGKIIGNFETCFKQKTLCQNQLKEIHKNNNNNQR